MKTKSAESNGKKLYIFILIVLFGIYLYNFPIQKARAEKAVDKYMQLQVVDFTRIESRETKKDWTQNGHYIYVTYKNDPGRIYKYHYKKNGTVNLIIFNSKWQSIATLYSEPPAKYPRLTE